MKSVFEFLYIFEDNYNLYGQFGFIYNPSIRNFNWENVNGFVGFSKQFELKENLLLTPYVETGLGKTKYILSFGTLVEYDYNYSLLFSLNYFCNNYLRIQLELSYMNDNYKAFLRYSTKNLIDKAYDADYFKSHILMLGIDFFN